MPEVRHIHPTALPNSVRYVKNGKGGIWWPAAKANSEIHAGWREVPEHLLKALDLREIEAVVRSEAKRNGQKSDFNSLKTLIDRPSQHLWVTFQDGFLWWCTVRDQIEVNPETAGSRGHFWLKCASPWSNVSVGGTRQLVMSNLPGVATAVAGFRATVCKPEGSAAILRIIREEIDEEAAAADMARRAYEHAVERLIVRLGPKDFEVLIDLILARSGWARIAKLGGVTEGIDIEVENSSVDEIAFVQVKSRSDQSELDDYVARFSQRTKRYSRMIFAVHSPAGDLIVPSGLPIQLWTIDRISALVVKHGLGEWLANRL